MNLKMQEHQIIGVFESNIKIQKKVDILKKLTLEEIDIKNIEKLFSNIQDTFLQREFISLIGRQRDVRYTNFLFSVLDNQDPKIIMQGIRALLCLKNNEINNKLETLAKHPNEMIRDYINALFNRQQNKSIEYSVNKKIKNVVVLGNTLDVMKSVQSESVHLTFTSPPYYNARDYSIYQSYNEYLEFLSQVFQELYRITHEGRFFIINTSPIIIPRAGRQFASKRYPIPFDIHRYIIEAGFEFIDDIIWVKPEASVKNRNGGFQQHRKPLAYKPNTVTEYIMVYRKKTNKLIDWNIKQYKDDIVEQSKVRHEYETTNLWNIDPKSDKIHSAIFPDELCKRVISFYSYVGDIVFDPFAGSGTFGKVALENNRNCFLTEINKEYFERIQSKLSGLFTNYVKYVPYSDFVNL